MRRFLSPDLCRELIIRRESEILAQLEESSAAGDEIVLSALTYAELVAGALQTAAQTQHMTLVQAFCERLDAILPWDSRAVDAYTEIQLAAMHNGLLLNLNDAMLAAHALSLDAELLCLNSKAYSRIGNLRLVEMGSRA